MTRPRDLMGTRPPQAGIGVGSEPQRRRRGRPVGEVAAADPGADGAELGDQRVDRCVERPDARGRRLDAVGLPRGRRAAIVGRQRQLGRSEEHTSELQSLMRISYAVFCLKKKKKMKNTL